MARFTGSCHCGNLTFALDWPEGEAMPLRRCDCSFCTRHGGVYASHPRAALLARVRDCDALSRYTFATKTAEFFVCSRCGVAPWATSVIEGRTYAVVNANAFDAPPRTEATPIRSHDGETVEERLARRKRSWIADVAIDDRVPGTRKLNLP